MKQLVQPVRGGSVLLEDVAAPALQRRGILLRTRFSVISPGTEAMLVELANLSLLGKARARPDLVKKAMRRAWEEGLGAAVAAVKGRLDSYMPLGYSSAGIVDAVGPDAGAFQVGQRVACAGAGFACHAELAYVPRNLVVPVPEGVDFETAAFATVGAIAVHASRIAELEMGERVVVIGLGLIGLLTIQVVRAAGCEVLGIDTDRRRVEIARNLGVMALERSLDSLEERIVAWSGYGADAVLITAATSSSDPVELAGRIARDRGRVVLVGAVGMDVPRRTYYEKELSLRLSRSYGPGRYDVDYEDKGLDYPVGHVRWTEGRNLGAFLDLLQRGTVVVGPLVSRRIELHEAPDIYRELTEPGPDRPLGVVIRYDDDEPSRRVVLASERIGRTRSGKARLAVIGAGQFAKSRLLPTLAGMKHVDLVALVTGSGAGGKRTAQRFGFAYATGEAEDVFDDDSVDAVLIATRHDLHAPLAIRALEAGKGVFVEKPPAMHSRELNRLWSAYREAGSTAMVGFNRRYAPAAIWLREQLRERTDPLAASYRVWAGSIPADHWTQDPEQGGGRIVGEACHFVDLLRFLCDSPVAAVQATALPPGPEAASPDTFLVSLRFEDGSVASIQYLGASHREVPKERVEVTTGNLIAVLDDFRSATAWIGDTRRRWRGKRDKGHDAELREFVGSLVERRPLAHDFEESLECMAATLAVQRAIREGKEQIGPFRCGG